MTNSHETVDHGQWEDGTRRTGCLSRSGLLDIGFPLLNGWVFLMYPHV
jgi:hypothetical protein